MDIILSYRLFAPQQLQRDAFKKTLDDYKLNHSRYIEPRSNFMSLTEFISLCNLSGVPLCDYMELHLSYNVYLSSAIEEYIRQNLSILQLLEQEGYQVILQVDSQKEWREILHSLFLSYTAITYTNQQVINTMSELYSLLPNITDQLPLTEFF
ncbi:MAG: hypothetical protein INQ03_08925 [Candidatus Heimdallarchaeota archaeon]|nr:hypothetical protein [Candidatus Heimdallarchaeota archaeon]